MKITILNFSKKLSDQSVALMVRACEQQLCDHAAPAWGRAPISVVFQSEDKWPKDDYAIGIYDSPDISGAYGYHSQKKGQIFGKVFVNPVMKEGGTYMGDPLQPRAPSVSSTLSHEVLEFFADPFCNLWVDGPKTKQGSEYAMEISDPVEAEAYAMYVDGSPVMVSNFIYPAWFDDQASKVEQFDFLRRLSAPFSLDEGGYMVVRSAPGKESEVFASAIIEQKKASKRHALSRVTQRRGRNKQDSE